MTEVEIEGRRLRLSSVDRVVWPETGFTKGNVFDYYTRVAPVLLPHLADRPVTLARFPEGVEGYGWYQTQCRGPDWMPTRRVGTQDYCVVNDLASLLWLANAGTIEFHPLLSRGKRVHEPTQVVFDLDPGAPAGFAECGRVALLVRRLLDDAGLVSFPKASGSLGLHVHVPLAEGRTFGETRSFARGVAERLAAERPELVVARAARSLRPGKVLVDWAQNAEARSLLAPYSLRAMRVPTVAAPLTWDEVEAGSERAGENLAFAPAGVLERLTTVGDPFRGSHALTQRLP